MSKVYDEQLNKVQSIFFLMYNYNDKANYITLSRKHMTEETQVIQARQKIVIIVRKKITYEQN